MAVGRAFIVIFFSISHIVISQDQDIASSGKWWLNKNEKGTHWGPVVKKEDTTPRVSSKLKNTVCSCTEVSLCEDTLPEAVERLQDDSICRFDEVCCVKVRKNSNSQPLTFREKPNSGDSEVASLLEDTEETLDASVFNKPDDPDDTPLGPSRLCGVETRHLISDLKGGSSAEGPNTDFGQFPWVLAVYFVQKGVPTQLCGATLIDPGVAVTAAHCIKKGREKSLIVRGGEWDISTELGDWETLPHQDRRVAKVKRHDKYNEEYVINDYALLILEKPFKITHNVRPICMPTLKDKYSPICFTAGWGSIDGDVDPESQRYMRVSRLRHVRNNECNAIMRKSGKGPKFSLRSTQFCAKNDDGDGTCVGSCGGALFCQSKEDDKPFHLVGVASTGKCGRDDIGIFTSVLKFYNWTMDYMDSISSR